MLMKLTPVVYFINIRLRLFVRTGCEAFFGAQIGQAELNFVGEIEKRIFSPNAVCRHFVAW
jgi:hypothetical protein